MTKKVITFSDNSTHTVHYENSDDNTVVKFDVPDTENANKKQTITSHSKTDSFGRKVFDELQIGRGFVSRQFSYMPGAITEAHKENRKIKSTATTQLVSHIALSDGRTISYKYDDEERIIEVTDTIDGTVSYTYDALGQLETETKDGVTTKFEYDNYGNITAKGVVDETGEIVEATKISYVYGNDTWRDLLTSYNGQSITYDAQGNPTNYLGHTLTWEKGRQLKIFDNNTYTYNANGIRTSKTVNGVKHEYTLDGTKILRETWEGNTLIPLYDNEDSVCGIIHNDIPYYFIKNLQGDIIAIVDKDAKTVARYSYDAWGAVTSAVTNTELTKGVDIAAINPFRYRGYYYDEEIELYYLQSRYYDAAVSRFINIDTTDSLSEAQKVLENNLFSYCHNNPTNETDYTGSLLTSIIKKILTGVFKGFIGLLGSDFITFLYNILLVDSNAKFVMSSGSDYLKSILSAVASELIDFLGAAKFVAQVFMIVGSYFTKLVNGRMNTTDWITLVLKLAMLILKSVLLKRLNKQKKKELDKLKKFKKKKSKNIKLKKQKKQIKIKFKKKGFKVNLTFDITEYVLENFLNILASI